MEPMIEDGQQYPMTLQQYYDKLYESAYDGAFPCVKIDSSGRVYCTNRIVDENGKEKACAAAILVPLRVRHTLHNAACTDRDNRNIFTPYLPEGMRMIHLLAIQQAHDYRGRTWAPASFIQQLNGMDCFRLVNKREPKQQEVA